MTRLALVLALALAACGSDSDQADEYDAPTTVVLASDVQWEQLNPARGDKSPRAGTLWGERGGPGPSGFLLRPVDGFRSPPHIHSAPYHGVVIAGTIHNAHPSKKDVFLPAGSFWTQPGGAVHITAAKGSDSLAYIEVEDTFDVLDVTKATSKEDGIALQPADIEWVEARSGAKVAALWGKTDDGQPNGTLVKLPARFSGKLRSTSPTFHAIVIQGGMQHGEKTLEPGSYFSSSGKASHPVASMAGCVIYIRTTGTFEIVNG